MRPGVGLESSLFSTHMLGNSTWGSCTLRLLYREILLDRRDIVKDIGWFYLNYSLGNIDIDRSVLCDIYLFWKYALHVKYFLFLSLYSLSTISSSLSSIPVSKPAMNSSQMEEFHFFGDLFVSNPQISLLPEDRGPANQAIALIRDFERAPPGEHLICKLLFSEPTWTES